MYSYLRKKIILPLADRAMSTSISSSLRMIERMSEFTNKEIQDWQHQKLAALVNHAYTNTKYYRKLFDSNGIKPSDIQTKSDLNGLPVLTKKAIRENFKDLIPDNIQDLSFKKASTGGSTGEPLKYLLDLKSWSFSNANTIFNWGKTGYKYGDKYVALGSTSLFVEKQQPLKHKLYYKLKNKIGLNGINMSDEVCKNYLNLMRKNEVRFIYGYASAVYLFAKYVESKNERLSIQACFTTSEILTKQYRGMIKKAFDCDIVDCYGAHDGGLTAFAHTMGFFEVNYNSLVNVEKKTKGNRVGPAILTDLFNYAMPLINYRVGDNVLIDDSRNNKYSYNGQIINKVMGRTSDIIELKNGRVLTGPGFTILFKDLPVEYYFIEKKGDNTICCHIKKADRYKNKHEEIIISTLRKQAGSDTQIKIIYTDKIFRSESGKKMYFKSE